MEQEKLHFVHKKGFVFAGAIFMSNRATKLECLQRKLFGLPQSKAKFLEQVKSGMLLFLFEHEERKLYGVFEATSDGALNIIPDAFRSTGQSYPAQICWKRILMCRPLCEDEFRSAIQENYYSPNKFHFGLSYDQVTNLSHLFYSKKINLKQHQKPVVPNRIIRPGNSTAEKVGLTEVGSYAKCESDDYRREGNWEVRREYTLPQSSLNPPMHSTAEKVRLTEVGSYAKCESDDYRREGNWEVTREYTLPQSSLNPPMHSTAEKVRLTEVGSYAKCESDDYRREGNWEVTREYTLPQSSLNLPMHYTVTDTERGSNQVNLHALELQPSRSQPLDSCSSLFVPNDRAPVCHFSTGKQCSTTEDMYYNKPLPQESDRYMTEFDSVAVPYSMGPNNYSSPDVAACVLSCDDMIQRQIKIEEPHVFESLRVVNDDRRQTVSLQHTSVYAAQPEQLFKFPDYIPLWEDLQQEFVEEENHNSGGRNFENVSSAAFRSCIPSTGKEISEAFYIDEEDEQKIYPRLVSDTDPIVSRASVFSRLSRGQNVSNPKTSESPTRLCLDQLSNILDSRRERWSTTEASKPSGKRGGGNQYDRTVSTEFFNQSSGRQDKFTVQLVEQSKVDQYECITETESVGFDTSLDYDQGNEISEKGSYELPFYNFRRRNMSQKFEVQDDLNTGSKRRRILRPSLYGEEQNAKCRAEVKTLALTSSKGEQENKVNSLNSEPEGESISSFVGPETELKTPTQAISEHETESAVSGFRTHQKFELEVESVSSFFRPETEVKTQTQAILEHGTESKVPGFQTRENFELEVESVSSFVLPATELKTPTLAILEHETESKVPGFQTCEKSELEVKSVSFFVHPETELKTPTQAISEHETESKVPGFHIRPKIELEVESASSFRCPETELKQPTRVILKHGTEKFPGFQSPQKSEMQGESISSFFCPQTELKPPTHAISEHETESKVPGFQKHRKYKLEAESVEANAVTSVLESEDYIPLG